jgi:hypothetical protein
LPINNIAFVCGYSEAKSGSRNAPFVKKIKHTRDGQLKNWNNNWTHLETCDMMEQAIKDFTNGL